MATSTASPAAAAAADAIAAVSPRAPSDGSSEENSDRSTSVSSPGELKRVPLAVRDFGEYSRRVWALYASSGAIILGNVLEWYDWTVYGYMEDVISELFMGGEQTATWLVFGLSFVARPLGSVLLGWVGDHCGRTVSLNIAIWGMAAGTVLSGCLVPGMPGAALMLILLRLLSGLSAGGEAAGVNTYMSEVGGAEKDETLVAAVGVNNISGALAFFLANVVSLAVHQLPREALLAWGWRVPFLLALPVGLISVVLRRSMHETEDFKEVQAQRAMVGQEPKEVHDSNGQIERKGDSGCSGQGSLREVLLALFLCIVVQSASVSWNYLPIYLSQWLRTNCGFSATAALGLTAMSKVMQLLMTFPVSCFGDRFGTLAAMIAGNIASAVLALPTFFWIIHLATASDAGSPLEPTAVSPGLYVSAVLLLGIVLPACMSFFIVTGMLFVNSLFPARLRGRGAGLGYALASTVGGFTPSVSSALATQGSWLPAMFITLLTLPSLAALLWCRRAAARGSLPVYQRPWLF